MKCSSLISTAADKLTITYYDWLFSVFIKSFHNSEFSNYEKAKEVALSDFLKITKRCKINTQEDIKKLISIDKKLNYLCHNINSTEALLQFKSEFLFFRETLDKVKTIYFSNKPIIDPLTKLKLRDSLDRVTFSYKEKNKVFILFIDLDDFKAINDSHGHDIGDKVLKKVAEVLSGAVRDTDLLIRYGGDEFVAILETHNKFETENIADRILRELTDSIVAKDITIHATIGITEKLINETLANAINRADRIMYDGKHKGKNTFTFI